MRLGVRVGQGCDLPHHKLMRRLRVSRLELGEAWSYVGKKQKRVTDADREVKRDQYVFIALAGAAKAIVSYRIGKRNLENTVAFLWHVRERVFGAPEIISDGFPACPAAVEATFGAGCTFGTIEKHYSAPQAVEAARRYSPAEVVSITTREVIGLPRHISTSYFERQNLTLRMAQRRITRLTNGFSKQLENHCAAVGLYVGWYNFCRVHDALRITPAMQLGVTDHNWTIGELVDAALTGSLPVGRRVA